MSMYKYVTLKAVSVLCLLTLIWLVVCEYRHARQLREIEQCIIIKEVEIRVPVVEDPFNKTPLP